jgi:hypothetical protein
MKKAIAEFIGTFALVLIGCGTAVIAGMGTGATAVDVFGIAAAFGLTIVAMAYGIGQVSGYHINPAVSFGVLAAGRMTVEEFITYVIAQVLGAIAGALVLISFSRARRQAGADRSAGTAGVPDILASTAPCRPSSTRWRAPSCSSSASSALPKGARPHGALFGGVTRRFSTPSKRTNSIPSASAISTGQNP